METPSGQNDESASKADIYGKYWSRLSKLQDRIAGIKDEHKLRVERIKKRKELKNSAKLANETKPKQTDSPKVETDGLSWSDVRPYLNINKHLVQTTGTNRRKSGLEMKVENAIKKHDLDEVITLSDHLAARDFAKQITDALDAKRYTEKRKADEEQKHITKRKKIAWGFEQKQRWETKGNM